MATEKRRLIDANEIEDLFYKQVELGATDLMGAFDDALQDAQTVDAVEVVHGRWEPHPGYPGYDRCSACCNCNIGDDWGDGEKWNYCPNCGAKMDGRSEGE